MKKVSIQMNIPGATSKQYEQVWDDLKAAGAANPKGLLHHVGIAQPHGILVYDTWESEEAFKEFGKTLMPLLAKNKMQGQEPIILPVHLEYNAKNQNNAEI